MYRNLLQKGIANYAVKNKLSEEHTHQENNFMVLFFSKMAYFEKH